MKKFLFVFLTITLAFRAYSLELKLLGGSNLSRYTVSPEVYYGFDWDTGEYRYKSSYKQGFLSGAGIEFSLIRNIALEIDGLYIRKGCDLMIFRNDIPSAKQNYVLNVASFPILLKIKFFANSSPYILGGGEFSYILSHKYKLDIEEPIYIIQGDNQQDIDIKDKTKKFDFGVLVGGGFEIKTRLASFFVEARYYFGLLNISSEYYPFQSIKTKAEGILFGIKI
jgi:hypothetical protein